MQWSRRFPSVTNPEELWRQRQKGKAQEHSQHKQMLENVPKIQHNSRCWVAGGKMQEMWKKITEKEFCYRRVKENMSWPYRNGEIMAKWEKRMSIKIKI